MTPRPQLLFLCTGNACRSQMAEAWARELHPGRYEVHSAGTSPGRLDPRAVRVMNEVGVDLSSHRAKHLDELVGLPLDLVITVCDRARESCPVLPGAVRRHHVPFDDPPALARDAATEGDALEPYRRVRDEIERFVRSLPGLF